MLVGEARPPEGMRLYAVGDIHGCLDAYEAMNRRIAEDLAARPAERYAVVHLGDYVDRGPHSAGVVQTLSRRALNDPDAYFLRGNHDAMLTAFLDNLPGAAANYLANGGDATLRSYGCRVSLFTRPASLCAEARERIPASHVAFLEGTLLSLRLGDYLFCHAGIRPGFPLDRQDPDDLVWIREPFLSDDRDHGFVVVHGHTPASVPEVRRNRINVDTGAVYGGTLTAAVLEGTDCRFLTVDGPRVW